VSAKNGLEAYCFNMKTTIEDEKLKDKISAEDRQKVNEACDAAIKWLDANHLAEVRFTVHYKKVIDFPVPKRNTLHCKKRLSIFPSPAGMSAHTKLSQAGNN
jgi:hypothetical protein